MVFEWDDWGASHVISEQCRSHDCRDQLYKLKEINSAFKCTLFAIPGEMTPELLWWAAGNDDWIELAMHGFFHSSNYECEKMTYEDFDMMFNQPSINAILEKFVKVFRAPGWMISDGVYGWLWEHKWIVCDQSYNDERRPKGLKAYVNYDNQFSVLSERVGWQRWDVEAYHGHVWDVGWNGIYEDFEKVADLVKNADSFQFISELFA